MIVLPMKFIAGRAALSEEKCAAPAGFANHEAAGILSFSHGILMLKPKRICLIGDAVVSRSRRCAKAP
jgi:hypothetical protein